MINNIVLAILGISTIIQVLEMCGFLPKKVLRWFTKNRCYETLEVLKEFGINTDIYRSKNATVGIPKEYYKEGIEKYTQEKLNELRLEKKVSVGQVRKTELNYYIDLIGHTCNPECSVAYAKLLSSYWADVVEFTQQVNNEVFDFVVTPKGGSPLLGYEFSKLLKKPFVLHEEHERFSAETDDMRKWFDCEFVPDRGLRGLIVDDSTTGGRMVLDTIEHLRKYGYDVTDCLVVFEPQNKDARRKLSDQGVNLISIIRTHEK